MNPIPNEVDLLVVGGGINGVGIARDAAGRGLKVLLCEQHDLAQHTSSASSKLVHGGLRSGTNFTGTPDGREGWATYFARKGKSVYVIDHAGRGRSGFDPTPINRVRDKRGEDPATLPTLFLGSLERDLGVRVGPGRILRPVN